MPISQEKKDTIVQAVQDFMERNGIGGEVELVFNDDFVPEPPDENGDLKCCKIGNRVKCPC